MYWYVDDSRIALTLRNSSTPCGRGTRSPLRTNAAVSSSAALSAGASCVTRSTRRSTTPASPAGGRRPAPRVPRGRQPAQQCERDDAEAAGQQLLGRPLPEPDHLEAEL